MGCCDLGMHRECRRGSVCGTKVKSDEMVMKPEFYTGKLGFYSEVWVQECSKLLCQVS